MDAGRICREDPGRVVKLLRRNKLIMLYLDNKVWLAPKHILFLYENISSISSLHSGTITPFRN